MHLVVVGGGTAGWLAALICQDQAKRAGLDLSVSVVESRRIPTIGVGEGTTAVFRALFQRFGFDELEFLRETEATIKFGIRHRDWRRVGVTYDGPIDDPHQIVAPPPGTPPEYLNVYSVAAGRPVADMHLFAHLMERRKSPYGLKPDGTLIPVGPFHYAYHFDQALVGRYLRKKSSGIAEVDGTVAGIEKDPETGDIVALDAGGGRQHRRRLLHRRHRLPQAPDRAGDGRPLALVRIRAAGQPRHALLARHRGGRGDRPLYAGLGARGRLDVVDPDPEALRLRLRLLRCVQDAGGGEGRDRGGARPNDRAAQRHPFRHRPAGAGMDRQLPRRRPLLELPRTAGGDLYPRHRRADADVRRRLPCKASQATDAERDDYNARVARQVDDFRTFINLHYVSERDDTPFWQFVRAESIHAETRERLERWRHEMPRPEHFPHFLGGLPHVEAQLHYPVLDGLGLLDRQVAKAEMAAAPAVRAFARKTVDSLTREYKQASLKAIGHAEYLALAREGGKGTG